MVSTAAPARARDADQTRRDLLRAARGRFARDGYSATTVRDIAQDAGVNVALINRYFESKERLFESCIARVGQELGRPEARATTIDELATRLVRKVVGLSADDGPDQLLLLLRTSKDERADAIRRGILRTFAEKLAAFAGWAPGGDDRLLVRAELVMAATLGMIQLRVSSGLEPLTSATEEQLAVEVRALLGALLTP
ncbi:TetR/AcrR family transcriptional regulator [soil metagenome]